MAFRHLDIRFLARAAARGVAFAGVAACATTGATLGSGVGDAMLQRPPYYAGARVSADTGRAGRIGHLPVAFQRGASQPAMFDPRSGGGSPTAALLAEMNAYLDSLGATVRLADAERLTTGPSVPGTPPDVRFGCATTAGMPDDDCAARADGALGRGRQAMALAVGRPSPEWIAWTRERLDDAGAGRALVITLEVGQYLTRQSGWRGAKSVELGTAHVAPLPWLTSLETPVSVLQLTGALVDTDGKAVRIGAEGVLARRTRLAVSALGAQEPLRDEDVAEARTARRSDLPGEPLAWQVALRHLVAQLTGRPDLAR